MEKTTDMKDISRYAGERGAVLGLYFIAVLGLIIGEFYLPVLTFVCIAMMIYVPFIVYRFLKKAYRLSGQRLTFGQIWLQGMLMFFCAAVVLTVGVYVYLKFISPNFFVDMLAYVTQLAESSENATLAQQAIMLREVIAATGVPRAIEFGLNMGWSCMFTGSLLCLLLAAILKVRKNETF